VSTESDEAILVCSLPIWYQGILFYVNQTVPAYSAAV